MSRTQDSPVAVDLDPTATGDTMPESLNRFPIRCDWSNSPFHEWAAVPASTVLVIGRPCGHEVGDCPSCADCAADRLAVGEAKFATTCDVCGAINRPQILQTRTLNEGDLP